MTIEAIELTEERKGSRWRTVVAYIVGRALALVLLHAVLP
jgi:hypothetical protein